MAPQDEGLYRLNLIGGDVGVPGAPLLHLHLLVDAPAGTVSGLAVRTQAVAPPAGRVSGSVTGRLTTFGEPAGMRLLTLHGEAVVSLPPPAIGEVAEPIAVRATLDESWKGSGTWSFGADTHVDAPFGPDTTDAG
jgi:hypothetical protein